MSQVLLLNLHANRKTSPSLHLGAVISNAAVVRNNLLWFSEGTTERYACAYNLGS